MNKKGEIKEKEKIQNEETINIERKQNKLIKKLRKIN